MSKITVRLFVPDGSGYRCFDQLTDTEREAFSQRCAERIGTALEPYYSINTAEYKALNHFNLTEEGGVYGHH